MHYIPLVLLAVQSVRSASILCIFPSLFDSHQTVFQPISHALALRGHDVTVIATSSIINNTLPNLREINLRPTHKLYEDSQFQEVSSSMLGWLFYIFSMGIKTSQKHLQQQEVLELINSDMKYDLMIAEIHTPLWFGFAKKYDCPVIGISSVDAGASNFFKRLMGNVLNPVLTPNRDLPFVGRTTLFQRFVSVIYEFGLDVWTRCVINYIDQDMIKTALNRTDINLHEILRNNVSLLFLHIIPGFHDMIINLPTVIPLQGLHIKPLGTLPDELQRDLDSSPEGVIYLSFGSAVRSTQLPQQYILLLLRVLGKLPFKVIWKYDDQIHDLPNNIKLMLWTPQQDILRHKNTKLFITQGGQQSVQEAIKFRVPMLAFPFFGDQFYNAKTIRLRKIGTWLTFEDVNEQKLTDTILETINNITYLKHLDELSTLMEEPVSSMDKVIWWIEYVLKHKGASHLRTPLAEISFFQYSLLDVFFLLTGCVAVISFAWVKLLTILLRRCKRVKTKVD